MRFGPAIGAGIAAGAAGAGLWAAVAYFANLEIGWLAWGIGAAVGAAMAVVAGKTGPQLGAAAVVITILALCAGKYTSVKLVMGSDMDEVITSMTAQYEDPEVLKSLIAHGEVQRRMSAGEPVNWPPGMDLESASGQSDYPPEVWKVATDQWEQMSAEQRTKFKQEQVALVREGVQAFADEFTFEAFKESFGAMDLLFFGLAIFTAFSLAGRQA